MKKFSLPLAIREIQSKTYLRFYITLLRIAIIKETNNSECCKDKETSYTDGGNVN
jgi:hypothetical protein